MVKRWDIITEVDGVLKAGVFVLASDYDRLEAACLQEHSSKDHEPECPICEALRPPTSGEVK